MGSINEEYIIKPFTVDDKGSITLDDAFSVSIDDNNIFLNIHVSLIGFEFIQDCYSFDDLWKETKSTKIRKYLGEDITSDYTLHVGKRKVLTLKIKKTEAGLNVCYAKCEEIEIANNFWHTNVPVHKDFLHYANEILPGFTYENSHEIVACLMGHYSSSLSVHLYNNAIAYVVKTNIDEGEKYKKGNFTSPMRKRDSLINQFIFLKYMEQLYSSIENNILQLCKKEEQRVEVKEGGRKKAYTPRRIVDKDQI